METITTRLAPRFVVQYTFPADTGRGGGTTYGRPETVAVTNTREEAFAIVRGIGNEAYAEVLEVYNPILLNGKVTMVPNQVHRIPPPAAAPVKKKVAAARRR